eukprot:5911153-Pleurochrysis_carterae.AAC.3
MSVDEIGAVDWILRCARTRFCLCARGCDGTSSPACVGWCRRGERTAENPYYYTELYATTVKRRDHGVSDG